MSNNAEKEMIKTCPVCGLDADEEPYILYYKSEKYNYCRRCRYDSRLKCEECGGIEFEDYFRDINSDMPCWMNSCKRCGSLQEKR